MQSSYAHLLPVRPAQLLGLQHPDVLGRQLNQAILVELAQGADERLGGRAPVPVDVRVIAATHRDLQAEVAAGRFRPDLYYRLHVLPIVIPPLRERPLDVPLLADFFLRQAAQELHRPPQTFGPAALAQLQTHAWPGNVRELQHAVERAALFTPAGVIQQVELAALPMSAAMAAAPVSPAPVQLQTLEEAERELITATLRHCKGRIRGVGGAAELLNILPNTLDARIQRLGIERSFG